MFRTGFPHFQATIFKIFTKGLGYVINVKYLFFCVWRPAVMASLRNGKWLIITFCSSRFSQIVRGTRMKLVFILAVCFHISCKSACNWSTALMCFGVQEEYPSDFPVLTETILCRWGTALCLLLWRSHGAPKVSRESSVVGLWARRGGGHRLLVRTNSTAEISRGSGRWWVNRRDNETQRTVKSNFNCTEFKRAFHVQKPSSVAEIKQFYEEWALIPPHWCKDPWPIIATTGMEQPSLLAWTCHVPV